MSLQNVKYANDITSIVIPVLNIARRELRLRTELTFWLQEAVKLNSSLLVCRDDLNLTHLPGGNVPGCSYCCLLLLFVLVTRPYYGLTNNAHTSYSAAAHRCYYLSCFADGHNVLLSLVDHNENKQFEEVATLTQIIDHHTPTRDLSTLKCDDIEIKEGVGSCCSLLAERYLSAHRNGKSKPDVQVALMLYGPILLGKLLLCRPLSGSRAL